MLSHSGWDPPDTHRLLAQLTLQRAAFRIRRTVRRLSSPRRLVATGLAILFFLLYVANGVFVFTSRAPADPERLRLWLSGGMVLYAIYHAVRCAWSKQVADLEWSEAEKLWLGGGPLRRSTLAVSHLGNLLFASLVKTVLLVVLLATDVAFPLLLALGMFVSLVLLETLRLVIERAMAGGEGRYRYAARAVTAAAAIAIVTHLLSHVAMSTPAAAPPWQFLMNGFRALGGLAASQPIQLLALPWLPAAGLAVTERWDGWTVALSLASLGLLPLAVMVLVRVDGWASRQTERREQRLLQEHDRLRVSRPLMTSERVVDDAGRTAWGKDWRRFGPRKGNRWDVVHVGWWDRRVACLPEDWTGTAALILRQWISVRRHAGSVAFSFAIPMLLALSPLITGTVDQQWFFVVGGVAIYTVLLAPPALRIDFRRDLKRVLLLRGFPIKPLPMAIGQLLVPVLITIIFQCLTVAIAAGVLRPAWNQWALWSGILAALAVVTFALENALFLAYPHHERAEGVAMMVRAKLTFLGKVLLLMVALGMLFAWATVCRQWLPIGVATGAFVGGAVLFSWGLAIATVAAVAWCWSRFDLCHDVPPE